MRSRAEKQDKALLDKASRRLGRLPSMDILNWLDQAGSGMARALNDFRRDEDPLSLEEAHEGALALLAGIELLQGRAVREAR